MTAPNPLLAEIDAFLSIPGIGISATRFGIEAMKDSKFVSALRNGRRVWPDTEQKVREYMRAEKERRILALGGKIDRAA